MTKGCEAELLEYEVAKVCRAVRVSQTLTFDLRETLVDTGVSLQITKLFIGPKRDRTTTDDRPGAPPLHVR